MDWSNVCTYEAITYNVKYYVCIYTKINLFKINKAVHVFHKRCAKISLIFVSNKLGHVPKFTKSLFVCRKYARHTRLAPSNNLGRIYYLSCC